MTSAGANLAPIARRPLGPGRVGQIEQHDLRPGLGQGRPGRQSEPGGSAGHEGNVAVDAHLFTCLLAVSLDDILSRIHRPVRVARSVEAGCGEQPLSSTEAAVLAAAGCPRRPLRTLIEASKPPATCSPAQIHSACRYGERNSSASL